MLPIDIALGNRELTAACHAERARETGCWVVSADVVGRHDGWIAHGNTRIFDPTGRIIAEVPEGEPGLVMTTIG